MIILTILIVGLSGLVAQVLLLRELLVSFNGNELTLGIILANWIILEALGVFIIGKFIDAIKSKFNVFIILQIIFSLVLPFSIYLSRTFKYILGVPIGEAIGLNTIFFSSFLIILPIGFCHGALFACAAKIYSLRIKEPVPALGRIYAWETIGTIIGGLIVTFLLIPYLNSFQAAFIISFSNIFVCLFFLPHIYKALKYITISLIVIIASLFLIGAPKYFHHLSLNRQWHAQEILDYRNSIYGNIAVTKQLEQYTFFYNGLPVIVTPYPDKQFVEEFGHLPLLFHPAPKDILIISAGAGGLINEISKHPVRKIDYAELDPLIIEMLKKYPTRLTESELSDKRLNIKNMDARLFLRLNSNQYDVISIGMSNQSDLSTNRLFTQEFFSLAKKRLNKNGILAFWITGSFTYLGRELRDLNNCILNALTKTFSFVRIIPGDYNIFLASSSRDIMNVSAQLIFQRISEQNIRTNILTPAYLDYRLNKSWSDWFAKSTFSAAKEINQDLKPIAVFEMLQFTNKKFSPGVAGILEAWEGLNLKGIFIFVFLITLGLIYIFYRRPNSRLSIVYSIATTGFFGMLINLILVFSFQAFYGYLYYRIGILVSIFMSGIAAGSIFMAKRMGAIKNAIRVFLGFEGLIIAFSYFTALTITKFMAHLQYSSLIFTALFFISGLLIGLEFPLASRIYMKEKEQVGEVAGTLYAADLMGGWLAGIIGGIILLPVLGLFNTCLVIIIFKLSSLSLLLLLGKKWGQNYLKNKSDPFFCDPFF